MFQSKRHRWYTNLVLQTHYRIWNVPFRNIYYATCLLNAYSGLFDAIWLPTPYFWGQTKQYWPPFSTLENRLMKINYKTDKKKFEVFVQRQFSEYFYETNQIKIHSLSKNFIKTNPLFLWIVNGFWINRNYWGAWIFRWVEWNFNWQSLNRLNFSHKDSRTIN